MTGSGPFLHNDPGDRPADVFGGTVTGTAMQSNGPKTAEGKRVSSRNSLHRPRPLHALWNHPWSPLHPAIRIHPRPS